MDDAIAATIKIMQAPIEQIKILVYSSSDEF
jgi:hypothetical protein